MTARSAQAPDLSRPCTLKDALAYRVDEAYARDRDLAHLERCIKVTYLVDHTELRPRTHRRDPALANILDATRNMTSDESRDAFRLEPEAVERLNMTAEDVQNANRGIVAAGINLPYDHLLLLIVKFVEFFRMDGAVAEDTAALRDLALDAEFQVGRWYGDHPVFGCHWNVLAPELLRLLDDMRRQIESHIEFIKATKESMAIDQPYAIANAARELTEAWLEMGVQTPGTKCGRRAWASELHAYSLMRMKIILMPLREALKRYTVLLGDEDEEVDEAEDDEVATPTDEDDAAEDD